MFRLYIVYCSDLYIVENKQPMHRRTAQHRRVNYSGQDSAVPLHLKDKGHSFEEGNVHVLAVEERWVGGSCHPPVD